MSNTKSVTSDDWKSTLKSIQQLRDAQKQTDLQLKKTDSQLSRISKQMAESDKKTHLKFQEAAEQLKKSEHLFTSRWGKFVESLVEGDIVKKFKERGLAVDGTIQRAKKLFKGKRYEFDIIVHNGEDNIVIEVKTTLTVKDVDHFIKNLKLFKQIFPQYTGNKVYGAVAYIVSDGDAKKYAKNQKLFVIRATGNSSKITNIKSFVPRIF